jgi:hypothetical protein
VELQNMANWIKLDELTGEQIHKELFRRLKKYKNKNFLEQFAMFMGLVQLLELALKNLLVRKFGVDEEKLETWTLGRTITALRKHGLRADYLALLDSVLEYRNLIAHELLANQALLRSISSKYSGGKEMRILQKATIELEQAALLYDWTQEHDAWT